MYIPSIKNILRDISLIFILEAAYYCPALAQLQTPSEATNSTWAEDDVPEIALSLDDAPTPGTMLFSGIDKTKAIIQKLQAVNSPAIGIFALGMYTREAQNRERLRMYGEAGHIIANHTYSHYRLDDITAQAFIKDIQKAHECLSSLHNFRPLFRFPYLCEGKDIQQRQEVMQALKAMGYQEGYITVCNHDYYINKLVLEATQAGKQIDHEKLKKVYINILWDCIATYERMVCRVMKRKVKHVLLLHENDLAALFIGDLIEHIRKQGWRVIAIEDAYKDPMADIDLMTNYGNTGRITAIGVEKGLGKGLVEFPPTTQMKYIAEALKQEKAFVDPPKPD
ncbi:MAG: polysaccharide deacetylase family protein [Bacteroidota bacterium]